ncbi:MAG: hypothetical protein U0263_03775 [Polyangiaceae bacterium]
MLRGFRVEWLLLFGPFVACVSSDFADGQYTCKTPGSKSECPDGFVCAADLRCRSGAGDLDAGADHHVPSDGAWDSPTGGAGGSDGGCSGGTSSGGTSASGGVGGGGGTGACNGCSGGQVCFNGSCCTPQSPCSQHQCGQYDDGCGASVSCAPCDSPKSCKAGVCCPPRNPAVTAPATPPTTTGAPVCEAGNATATDGTFAYLACVSCSFSNVKGVNVTSCIVADFGVVANLDPIAITARPDGGQSSSDPACKNDICIGAGCQNGWYYQVFHSATGADVGSWNAVTGVTLGGPQTDNVAIGSPTRYVIVCRGGAGKDAANIAIDGIESHACP